MSLLCWPPEDRDQPILTHHCTWVPGTELSKYQQLSKWWLNDILVTCWERLSKYQVDILRLLSGQLSNRSRQQETKTFSSSFYLLVFPFHFSFVFQNSFYIKQFLSTCQYNILSQKICIDHSLCAQIHARYCGEIRLGPCWPNPCLPEVCNLPAEVGGTSITQTASVQKRRGPDCDEIKFYWGFRGGEAHMPRMWDRRSQKTFAKDHIRLYLNSG